MTFILLALAIAPGLAIAIFIYEKDKLDKEPLHLLVKTFILGVVSALAATFIQAFLGQLLGWNIDDIKDIPDTFSKALLVGFTEEWCKYMCLVFFAYRKKEFNEPFDGITYGVMIAMGFATFENIFYVIEGGFEVAILRMFTAVPAHATFAVAMGYFVGAAKFKHNYNIGLYKMIGLASATLLHASYDFFFFVESYPIMAFGGIISLLIGIWLSIRAIRLHNYNSPFNHQRHPVESEKQEVNS
ncbi:PrsW family intramembrane metalloprotease [Xanthocytophaga flava]|uniref:PrsW family intramembrane metalloprotease n=1 Tax=Xanthocytophaga flava TaxID=3048013 RepID=UPI0028D31A13|nr:PrsW family glutamic-type intramembrane protease [Xanthocytophaga flavus]MDJ1468365.1 PrsW family glutamic-type intramembrane protease [Xanthocytophaga flavus]